MQANEARILAKFKENPKKVIDGARRGAKQDLMELANLWQEMGPELLNLDVLSVFYGHLDGSFVPSSSSSREGSLGSTPAIDRAWISLIALTKLGKVVVPPHPRVPHAPIEAQTIKAWPGIFKWCTFVFTMRVANTTASVPPELRRAAMDLIGGVLYSLSRLDAVAKTITSTPGSIELATRLYTLEDACPAPSTLPIPVGAASLDALITMPECLPQRAKDAGIAKPRNAEEDEKAEAAAVKRSDAIHAVLDRVVSATGGDATHIVEFTFSRLRTTIKNTAVMHQPQTAITLDLIGHLSRGVDHGFRFGFLSRNMTAFVTKLAVKIVELLDNIGATTGSQRRIDFGGSMGMPMPMHRSHPHEQGLHDALIACLVYLYNTLESTDGFTWVAKSVAAGLLQAWTGAARHMHNFDSREDAEMALEIMSTLLPRYLVYRSVVDTVHSAIPKLTGDGPDTWKDSEAREVWTAFHKLAEERYMVGLHMKAFKGKAVTCDNVKCQKIDLKNNFMKCASCSNTFYCSRECQTVAWKEGGHKTVCKLKQQEFFEGKYQSIAKLDSAYFHHLATRDSKRNLDYLKNLAAVQYPHLADNASAFIIAIDYLVVPPVFSLYPLSEHERYASRVSPCVSANAEARNDELVQRAINNPGKYGLIRSKIANGQGIQLVQTIVAGAFWEAEGWGGNDDILSY